MWNKMWTSKSCELVPLSHSPYGCPVWNNSPEILSLCFFRNLVLRNESLETNQIKSYYPFNSTPPTKVNQYTRDIKSVKCVLLSYYCQKCQNNLVRIVIRGAHADCRERGCIISYRCLLLNQSKLWCTPSTHNTQSFNNKLANQTWAIQNEHVQCAEKNDPFYQTIPLYFFLTLSQC